MSISAACPVLGTRRVSVDELLAGTRPPGADSWSELFDSMLSDPHDAALVVDLVAALERDGCFAKPLVVVDGELLDGFHRLAAALDADVGHLYVTDDVTASDSNPVEVVLELAVLERPGLDDELCEAMRSLAVGRGWASSPTISVRGTALHGVWFCERTSVRALGSELARRAGTLGVSARVVRCEALELEEGA